MQRGVRKEGINKNVKESKGNDKVKLKRKEKGNDENKRENKITI